ncbi:MAG: alpha/beta hydrolase [Microscillaceae bacterium]|nr:alpha/beta hydrolase [Microscillaceae bacterium]MDW8460579.1 alpha/beta hydrolase [Cytophagales bacterium]
MNSVVFPTYHFSMREGVRIAYIDTSLPEDPSQKPTIIWVHGITSQALIWEKNIIVLREFCRCVALDLPGHGSSEKGLYEYSLQFYGQSILQLLEHLKLSEPVYLVAHSMGGQIAIKLVTQYPQLFRKLILVAPAGFEPFTESEKLILAQITADSVISRIQYYKFILNLKDYFYALNEKEYQKLAEFSRTFYDLDQNPFLHHLLERSVKAMLYEPVLKDLPKIKIPTLVFFGKNDKLIPNRLFHPHLTTQQIAESACKRIRKSKLILYDKCGHFLQYEQPIPFNTDLYQFIFG